MDWLLLKQIDDIQDVITDINRFPLVISFPGFGLLLQEVISGIPFTDAREKS